MINGRNGGGTEEVKKTEHVKESEGRGLDSVTDTYCWNSGSVGKEVTFVMNANLGMLLFQVWLGI